MPRTVNDPTPQTAALVDALERVRTRAPLVQCVTNAVVMQFTANALLALGASPAMVDIPDEAGAFASGADALLVNLGTPYAEQRDAAGEAVEAACAAGVPWVLDPVAVGMLPVRTPLAVRLVAARPTVVRGNASEVVALAATAGLSDPAAGGRGTDATLSVDEALRAAGALAGHTHGVVAVSGPVDAVTDGDRVVRIDNGNSLLTRVTGGGCALGACVAAFLGATRADQLDPLVATVAAVTAYGVAAEVAAEVATGPGSFAVALIDALHHLDATQLTDRASVVLATASAR
ncbi:hydroxyethylthiazole kinase [Nocardioides massiliensis]|uniref:Hydroxyethylthiazole kinase n=1 Tax=Nocardioides massiliensis TaxID=1325935 RepID=A0ABT9NPH8_9ACTN|nr:hydroxyethylthiazole kinase [Nocardioides massiliensis]MDP9822298.1 hydroxyethylthiazole kinase [Nocardioides massiliensis]